MQCLNCFKFLKKHYSFCSLYCAQECYEKLLKEKIEREEMLERAMAIIEKERNELRDELSRLHHKPSQPFAFDPEYIRKIVDGNL